MKKRRNELRVAIVYDRVNKWGGAERVLLTLHEMFPEAPLYTSVYSPGGAQWAKVFKVRPSFINRIYFLRSRHEWLALLMPLIFESFDFLDYDLVISVTSEAAKGIITTPETKHVCIILTPTRYLWSHYEEYFDSFVKRIISWPTVAYLRWWDRVASQRPDVMVAISTEVQERIKKYYGRESIVIFPPYDLSLKNSLLRVSGVHRKTGRSFFEELDREYYLVVSRLVKYKKIDLVIKAFNKMNKKLIIVGKGKEETKLRIMAEENIKFVRDLNDVELAWYYKNAKALIVSQKEDFGLVMVEAMNQGTPVIANKEGGSLDIVVEGVNGIHFDKCLPESIMEITDRFETMTFDSTRIKRSVGKFSATRFRREFLELI